MADKDYFPSYSTTFDPIKNLLFSGRTDEAAQACASKIFSQAKKAFEAHAKLFSSLASDLERTRQLVLERRKGARFQPVPSAPDKDAELLRRAACGLHIDLQRSEFVDDRDVGIDLGVAYLLAEERYHFLDQLEGTAAFGDFQTDENLPLLFEQHQEKTGALYREAVEDWRSGKSLDKVRIAKPKLGPKEKPGIGKIVQLTGSLKG